MIFDGSTQLGRDLAAVDWAATALGPWQEWPSSLVNTVRLMTGSRFAMWMGWGPQLTFFCNDSYRLDTLGTKYPWALGRPSAEVWSEIWPDIGPRIESVINGGGATWDEALQLFLKRSGYTEETYHTFSYSPIHDDDGRIAGLLCVVSEETSRVIGERRMALLRDLGAALGRAATELEVASAAQLQASSDPFDLPFALTYVYDPSTGAAHLQWASGITAGAVAAPPVVHRDDRSQQWHEVLFDQQWTTHLVDLSALAGLPTGGWKDAPQQALGVPLRQVGQREPYGYLIVGLNPYRAMDDDYRGFAELIAGQLSAAIARARAFDSERDRVERLAELDRAKTTFFTNVSHELRTPLTLLLGPTGDALADTDHPLDDAQRARLDVVQRNAERLLKMVSTLLDFSRLESGRVQASYEQFDLPRFTMELASMFQSACDRSGLTLTIDCAPLPVRPYVDREMWSKIVLNLLSNALKATFSGGITVCLREQPDGSGALLEVSDTGVGIPAAELERLFERFHRVSGAALRTHEGSGIGLALVSELARLHGGTVNVESELDAGSKFSVRIPYGREHLPEEQVLDGPRPDVPEAARYSVGYLAEALRWLTPDSTAIAPRPDGRDVPRILVVDDNADMRDYLRDLLRESYVVDTAPDGNLALAQVRAAVPDLILTDVMMPSLDGFGLLSALRADPATMHIPVIMLSARSGDEATVEGLEAGADDYLVKPFSARELLARVRANLELDRVRRLMAEMARQQELLDHAEREARIGSWEIDLDRTSVRMSAELFRIMGFAPDESATVAFRSALEMVDREDGARFQQQFDDAVATGRPIDVEVWATRSGGERYLTRIRGTAVRDEDGDVVAVRGSSQDITEQRAAEVAVAHAHADREAAAREHAIATELQASLLPAAAFEADHLDIATFYRAGVAGTQVGGDWQDVIDLGAGCTALVIGDVMGRGVRAAAVMGQLRAAVRAYARLDLAPADLIRLLDDTVREIDPEMIVTCVYAVYDPSRRALTYANAGHLPPLITEAGQPTRRLTVGGPPLGAGRHGQLSETVELEPAALLTLYTDGLVERRGSDIDAGIERLAGLLASSTSPLRDRPTELTNALLPDGPDDDVAVLLCQVTDRSADDRAVTHEVGDDAAALGHTRQFVERTLSEWGSPEGLRFDVQLAVSELVTNAINHGDRPITARLKQRRDTVVLEVDDCGSGTPTVRQSRPHDVSGRGLQLVSSVVSRWGVRKAPAGKTVWCEFRRTERGRTSAD